jgi:magnesium chelatase family protein
VPPVAISDLDLAPSGETSATVAARVAAARAVQETRFDATPARTNADAEGNLLGDIAQPAAEAQEMLVKAADRFNLSARGYHRVLRVARTIADLDGADTIAAPHVAEALSYRLPAGVMA